MKKRCPGPLWNRIFSYDKSHNFCNSRKRGKWEFFHFGSLSWLCSSDRFNGHDMHRRPKHLSANHLLSLPLPLSLSHHSFFISFSLSLCLSLSLLPFHSFLFQHKVTRFECILVLDLRKQKSPDSDLANIWTGWRDLTCCQQKAPPSCNWVTIIKQLWDRLN